MRSSYRDPALALRAVNGAYRGGYQTHQVAIANGAVELTPQRANGERGGSLRFETSAVSRGVTAMPIAARATKLSNANELRIDRTSIVEEIENREEGIEQRWHFAAAPAGEGDLFVKVAVSGFDPEKVTSSNGGLHFFAPKGLGFRYSHAKWIDSAGGAWDIGSRWENGRIVMRVDEHILAQTTFPATLDPTVEAEEAVDDPVLGNSGGNAFAPYIASRGDGYLAVWADQRASNRSDIFAARINALGGVLDYAGGIVVNAAADTQTTPVAARVGANWVVVWRTVQDLAAATVTDDGVVTQLGSVAATANNEQLPAIAADGASAVVAWQSGNDIFASYFNGTSFGAPFAIATAGNEADPSVAASPAGYIVSWHDDVGVKAQLLTSAGGLSGTAIDVAPSSSVTAAAFNGTDYVLTYTFGNDVYGSRVSTTGTLVDAMPMPLGVAAGLQHEVTVSCNSSTCMTLWSDTRTLATTGFDVYGRNFDFNMVPVGAEFLVSGAPRYQVTPSIASTQLGFVAVWDDQRTGGASLAMGSRIGNDSSVQDPAGFVVNQAFNAQQEAATSTASNGSQVVLWSDSRVVGNDVMAVRYSSVGGGRLDSPPKLVSGADGDQATPTVSFDGTNFMAVWGDARGTDRDIYAARFGTDGTLQDANGIAVTTAAGIQGAPDVASGGGVSLAVWADRRNGNFDIFGAIITPAGSVSVVDIPVSVEVNDQNAPAVAYDPTGGVFVVVWSDQRTLQSGDIYGTRVSTAGVVLDPAGVPIATSQFEQVQPDIAVSGNVIMAVWDDRRSDPNGDIIGGRLSTANNMLTALDAANSNIPISYLVPGRQNSPALMPMPNNTFLVAWTDHRDAASVGSDIYGVTISSQGTPADTTGFVIAGGAGDQTGAAFQSDPNSNSRVAIVYQYYRSDLKVSRVFRRLITVEPTGAAGAPNGTICQLDSQCASGFCIDAMCCNSSCGGNFNQTDCQTCNTIYGGTVDGQCTVIVVEAICRNFATFDCDIREYCDGVNPECPPDEGRRQGESCTTPGGQPGTCPSDAPPGPHVCQ